MRLCLPGFVTVWSVQRNLSEPDVDNRRHTRFTCQIRNESNHLFHIAAVITNVLWHPSVILGSSDRPHPWWLLRLSIDWIRMVYAISRQSRVMGAGVTWSCLCRAEKVRFKIASRWPYNVQRPYGKWHTVSKLRLQPTHSWPFCMLAAATRVSVARSPGSKTGDIRGFLLTGSWKPGQSCQLFELDRVAGWQAMELAPHWNNGFKSTAACNHASQWILGSLQG